MVGDQVNFFAYTMKGEIQGRGTVLSYIKPKYGARHGSYCILIDENTFKTIEVDERDVWQIRKAA